MLGVAVEIRRYVDDDQPGWVECGLTDVGGRAWMLIAKVPVVTDEYLDAHSRYPRPGVIACEVVERRWESGQEVVVIDTELPWHVEATSGDTRFVVRPGQLLEFDWGWSTTEAPATEPSDEVDGRGK